LGGVDARHSNAFALLSEWIEQDFVERADADDTGNSRHTPLDVVDELLALRRIVAIGGNGQPQHASRL
jgi:hypothetical protein